MFVFHGVIKSINGGSIFGSGWRKYGEIMEALVSVYFVPEVNGTYLRKVLLPNSSYWLKTRRNDSERH